MNIRLKIFAGACLVCIAARLAESHFHEKPVLPVAPDHMDNSVPVQTAADCGFLKFVAENDPDPFGPDLAAGEKLLAQDPSDTKGRAGDFLLSLCHAGQFQAALRFANEAPPDLKAGWLKAVFTCWAQSRPQDAMAALDSIPDESERVSLFQTIAATWAAQNPATLADFAESLPDGPGKNDVLNQVVDNWSLQDPEAFSAWLSTSPSGVDLDRAIAQLISETDSANRTPQAAMSWVEAINDPTLRYDSLVLVLSQWNESDPAGAQSYLNGVSWLSDSQRQAIRQSLQTPPAPMAANNGN